MPNLAEKIEADLKAEAEAIYNSTIRFAASFAPGTYEFKSCMETLADQKRVIERLITRLEETKREHRAALLNQRLRRSFAH